MALPAGRYGVTKNQLLKIKKLPMNTIKLIEELTEKFDLLGTAAFKNSTSVVTDSTDLVESGAVKDIVGWGNKNLLNIFKTINSSPSGFTINSDGSVTVSTSTTAITDLIIGNTAAGRLLLSGYPSDAIVSKGSDVSIDDLFLQIWYYDAQKTYITNQSEVDGEIKLSPPSNAVYFAIDYRIPANKTVNTVLYPMISKDGGAFEPYHESVSDSLAEKCDNSVIGTVEDGANPTKSYAVGEHMVRGGKFCTVTVAVNTSSKWTLGGNYVEGNIADCLVKQDTFSGTTSESGAIVIYNSNDRVILSAEVTGCTATLYKRGTGYGVVIKTPQGESIVETAVSVRYYYIEY